ncbi:MAG: hypothetical protein IT258_09460 [Saprospiraceae bacterium]|nr:hypothetical protein [Saprospiraceae bacterium]
MKKHFWAILAFAMFSATVFAQKDETLVGKTGLRLSGMWGGSNLGMSFGGDNHGMAGGFFGLEFNKALTVGISGIKSTESTDYTGQFDLDYRGLLLGYTYLSHKVIHPRVSFLMGNGKLKLKGGEDDTVFVIQPSAGAEVNVFRWFRLGVEGGYRFISNTSLPEPSDSEVSSAFVQLSLRFGWSWGRDSWDEAKSN